MTSSLSHHSLPPGHHPSNPLPVPAENTATIRNNAAQRLALLTQTLGASQAPRSSPIPRQIVNFPPAAVKAMATLGSHAKKHKVTVVGSGNW